MRSIKSNSFVSMVVSASSSLVHAVPVRTYEKPEFHFPPEAKIRSQGGKFIIELPENLNTITLASQIRLTFGNVLAGVKHRGRELIFRSNSPELTSFLQQTISIEPAGR